MKLLFDVPPFTAYVINSFDTGQNNHRPTDAIFERDVLHFFRQVKISTLLINQKQFR